MRRLVKLDLEPAQLGEAWYQLAQECRTAGNTQEANSAYRECMKYDTRFSYLARYQLALAADSETRRIMEFASDWQPCFLPGGTNTCPTNPLSMNDNFTKMKKIYAEAGGRPDNIRRGWLRTRL